MKYPNDIFNIELLPSNRDFLSHLALEQKDISGASSAYVITISEGVPFYSAYKSPSEYHAAILTKGGAKLEAVGNSGTLKLTASGKGTLYVVIAESKESLDYQMSRLRHLTPGKAVRQSQRSSRALRKEIPDIGKRVLSKEEREELENTVNLVSDYVLAQQDKGG